MSPTLALFTASSVTTWYLLPRNTSVSLPPKATTPSPATTCPPIAIDWSPIARASTPIAVASLICF